jgi:hypothetical protein
MRKQLLSVLTILLIAATMLVTGVAAHIPQIAHNAAGAIPATNAAFRDGMFTAKFDVEQGRKFHLSSGRWSTDADRASFITGYREGVRENRAGALQLEASEMSAYRDGLGDGSVHRSTDQPFQAGKTLGYLNAKGPERQAYATGYQLGYYVEGAGNAETIDATVQSPQFLQSGAGAR